MHDRSSCGLHTSSPSPTFSAARPPVRGQTAPGPRACPQHCRPATPTFAAGFRCTLRRPYVTTPHPRRTARSAVESTQRTACRTARCTARRTARYAARSQASTNRNTLFQQLSCFKHNQGWVAASDCPTTTGCRHGSHLHLLYVHVYAKPYSRKVILQGGHTGPGRCDCTLASTTIATLPPPDALHVRQRHRRRRSAAPADLRRLATPSQKS